jgi:PTH1 family peptidyl-tRNA hydrolase
VSQSGAALVVGLGNPGSEYERTRHNLGFRVVDELCARLDAKLRPVKGVRGLAAEARDGERRVILAEPTTYMNLSGEAIGAFARYYKVDVEDIVVVHDDLDLPLGTLRVKRGGGDGGHNGLKHVTRALGTPDYARVRAGIGRPSGRKSPADYVLEAFTKKEEEIVGVEIKEAADAALAIVRDGVEAVQNRVNGPAQPAPARARRIRKQAIVGAPVPNVWSAWTTREGVATFLAPEARIDLREGGAYEILFDLGQEPGKQGSEGCEIVSLREPNALSFTWNAPPEIPEVRAAEKMRVDLGLRARGRDQCVVSLAHSGWKDGPEWDKAFAYFERAWDLVLSRLQRSFEGAPMKWS